MLPYFMTISSLCVWLLLFNLLEVWHIANAQWIYNIFSWPLHCMMCFMPQTYLNQTFKNQELASMDGEPDSTFISVSGLMFPASLPSFWPRFLLQAYLPGLSTNIIPALTQIHCLYSFQLNSVFCFGLIYETWCVTKVTLVKSQVEQAGIARSQSDIRLPWLSARHMGGPSRISFHGLKYPMCCPQWVLRQKVGADVGYSGAQEGVDLLVSISCLPYWLWKTNQRGMEWVCSEKGKEMYIGSNKVKGWILFSANWSIITPNSGLNDCPPKLCPQCNHRYLWMWTLWKKVSL